MICQSLTSSKIPAPPTDPDLALLIDRWPMLPADVRQRIVVIARSASYGTG
jgi:hypothetical protein